MQGYSDLAADHLLNPQNVGDVIDATAIGRAGSYICGATMRVSLQIDEQQLITEAKFKAAGCVVLVATASNLTSLILGKTTGEAAALANVTGAAAFNCPREVAANRQHCAALACQTVVAAIKSYSNSARDQWSGDEALICTCFGVSERTIEKAITTHQLRTITEVTKACRAGAGCRSCYSLIEDILTTHRQ